MTVLTSLETAYARVTKISETTFFHPMEMALGLVQALPDFSAYIVSSFSYHLVQFWLTDEDRLRLENIDSLSFLYVNRKSRDLFR